MLDTVVVEIMIVRIADAKHHWLFLRSRVQDLVVT